MVYKIKFYMKSPLILQDYLHFDALIAATSQEFLNINKLFINKNTSDKEKIIEYNLPILKIKRENDNYIYCCSSLMFADENNLKRFTAFTRRRTDLDASCYRKKLELRRGTLKNLFNKEIMQISNFIYFYCATNKIFELENIIKNIYSIGSLRGQGYGQVKKYEILETNLKNEDCLTQNCRSLRTIPADLVLDASEYSLINSKSPYWLEITRERGVNVDEVVILKKELSYY